MSDVTVTRAVAGTMTGTATRTTTARPYVRVSHDQSGRMRSTDEQLDDLTAEASRSGVALGAPYTEAEAVSASRYSTKTRQGFSALLSDLRAGRFDSDQLWMWENSRMSRRAAEWVALADECERQGVLIYVHTDERTYDPRDGVDYFDLLGAALDSGRETVKLSKRVKRAHSANAERGDMHSTAYGYAPIRDSRTGKRTGVITDETGDPSPADVVRELFRRVDAGEALHAIAVDLNARGIPTPRGGTWSGPSVRGVVLSPVYAAYRAYFPKVRGEVRPKVIPMENLLEGDWTPLVDRDRWLRVRTRLLDPSRIVTKPGSGKYLLSMIAVCGVCLGPLAQKVRTGRGVYTCHRAGHVRVGQDALDEYGESLILAFLSDPKVFDRVEASGSDDTELRRVRYELSDARARLAGVADALASGGLSIALASATEQRLTARIDELAERERDLAAPPSLRGLVVPGERVADAWAHMPVSARREVARALLAPGYIGVLAVDPLPTKDPRERALIPVVDRVRLIP